MATRCNRGRGEKTWIMFVVAFRQHVVRQGLAHLLSPGAPSLRVAPGRRYAPPEDRLRDEAISIGLSTTGTRLPRCARNAGWTAPDGIRCAKLGCLINQPAGDHPG